MFFFISHISLVAVWISAATKMKVVSSVARISEEVLPTLFLLLWHRSHAHLQTLQGLSLEIETGGVLLCISPNHNLISRYNPSVFNIRFILSLLHFLSVVQGMEIYFKGEVIFFSGKNSFPYQESLYATVMCRVIVSQTFTGLFPYKNETLTLWSQ